MVLPTCNWYSKRYKMRIRNYALTVSIALMSLNVAAEDFRFSGFGTVNGTYNSFDSQYMELREGLTSDGSKLGFFLSAQLNDKLVFSSQILNKQSPTGRETEFRWVNLAYSVTPHLTFRIGKMPLTDRAIGDINYSNIWNNEPGEYFYQLMVRSFDGAQIGYEHTFKNGYRLETEFNAGEGDVSSKLDYLVPGVEMNVAGTSMVALMTTLRSSDSKFMFSYMTGDQEVIIDENSQLLILKALREGRLNEEALLPAENATLKNIYMSYTKDIGVDYNFYSGVTYASTDNPIFTPQYGYFAALTRHFDDFSVHYTYAGQREKVRVTDEWTSTQRSHKIGLTYNIDYDSNIRFETSYIETSSPSNDNFVMRLPQAKGYVSSVAYNFIF